MYTVFFAQLLNGVWGLSVSIDSRKKIREPDGGGEWTGPCTRDTAFLADHHQGMFQKWRWPFLHCPSKGIAVDKQANDDVVHLCRFREADRLPDQALNARPQGEMLALDFLGVTLPTVCSSGSR